CVSVVLPADEVFGGEQYLANSAVVVGEGLAVASHEDALTDRGDGLASGKVLRTRGESQWRDSGGDGARGDENDVGALLTAPSQHCHEMTQPLEVEAAGGLGQGGGADLDDDSSGLGNVGALLNDHSF